MELLLTSLLTFTSTNIDDIFILALFYSSKRFSEKEIITGQLLGIGILILVSLLASLLGLLLPVPYIGLLGLFPIYLGVKSLWALLNQDNFSEPKPGIENENNQRYNLLTIAWITIANGGDNIAIYIPLFATLFWTQKLIMIGLFLVMTVIWCFLAKYLTSHPLFAKTVDRYGHWITPIIFIILGVYILYESDTLSLTVH